MEQRPYLVLDISRLSNFVNSNTQDKILFKTVLFELFFRKNVAAVKRLVDHLLDLASQESESGDPGEIQSLRGDEPQH